MTWVNFRLDKMVIEARRSFSDRDQQELPDLNDLERIPQPQAEPSLASVVQDHIRADPDGIFQDTHVRNHPEVHFQAIALARFQGASWDDLSQQYDIKIPTLSSFFSAVLPEICRSLSNTLFFLRPRFHTFPCSPLVPHPTHV